MVSAYAHDNGLVLARRRVDDKSNEIMALPKIIKLPELTGSIASIDAMGCQKSIAKQIAAQGGDYVLSLKGNQGNPADAAEDYFVAAKRDSFELLKHDRYEDVDGDHGRIEKRCYDVLYEAEWLDPIHRVLDMAFREDECRVRTGNSAENLAILRHMAFESAQTGYHRKTGDKIKAKG